MGLPPQALFGMGELYEVLGTLRFSAVEVCPRELRGKTIKLKAREGDVFEVPAEVACIAARVKRIALQSGTAEEIALPLKKQTVIKVLDYMKYHKDTPAAELITPLVGDDLVECGATRWDAKFVEVEKFALFDLNLAASLLDIAGLFFLTSAKAALLYKDKSADKLRKEWNFMNDLPSGEEEAMARGLKNAGKARQEDANADIAALAVTMQATTLAAEKQGMLEAGALGVDPKSWRHACWRAAVVLDWHQLAIAPNEVRGDRDLILGALMASQGAALGHAAAALRADRALVLEAAKYSGAALKEASQELRNDRDFVLEAVLVNGAAMVGASETLRADRSFLLEAARRGSGSALQGATRELQNDPEFVLAMSVEDPAAFQHAPEELRNDREFALRVVARSGRALQYMPAKFKADREIVVAAVGENAEAGVYAHTARRVDLGLELPWDTQVQHKADAGYLEAGPVPGGARMLEDPFDQQQVLPYRRHKVGKSVQFSAMSTMTGNMGQANYTAANIYLDKLPFYQRPEIDAVTLMWGAVGNIGMRWKAFASADVLNATPDQLLTINDAARVLNATCCKMETPEWYSACFMDQYGREAFLYPSSGGGTGGGWKPSEDVQVRPREWRAEGLRQSYLFSQGLRPEGPTAKAASQGTPLGGWPGLVGLDKDAVVPQRSRPSYELEPGARVELVGLSSKNGTTGILIKAFSDGKWKVRLDDGSGNALLRGYYLKAITPANEVALEGGGALPEMKAGASAIELRRAKLEERRGRLKERAADKEVQQLVTVGST